MSSDNAIGDYVVFCYILLSRAPELDMSELESLFSATAPNSDYAGTTDKTNRRGSGGRLKPDKVHLVN